MHNLGSVSVKRGPRIRSKGYNPFVGIPLVSTTPKKAGFWRVLFPASVHACDCYDSSSLSGYVEYV